MAQERIDRLNKKDGMSEDLRSLVDQAIIKYAYLKPRHPAGLF